jgi:hypothetical protein
MVSVLSRQLLALPLQLSKVYSSFPQRSITSRGHPTLCGTLSSICNQSNQYFIVWTASQSNGAQIVLSAEVKSAVVNCNRACTDFQTLLDRWIKHSSEEKTFWIDRWRGGFFGQERIKAFEGQLSDCKRTLNMALSTASTYVCFVWNKTTHASMAS